MQQFPRLRVSAMHGLAWMHGEVQNIIVLLEIFMHLNKLLTLLYLQSTWSMNMCKSWALLEPHDRPTYKFIHLPKFRSPQLRAVLCHVCYHGDICCTVIGERESVWHVWRGLCSSYMSYCMFSVSIPTGHPVFRTVPERYLWYYSLQPLVCINWFSAHCHCVFRTICFRPKQFAAN